MLPLPHVQPAAARQLLRDAWRRLDAWTLQAFNPRLPRG
jgi:hypothetical protein